MAAARVWFCLARDAASMYLLSVVLTTMVAAWPSSGKCQRADQYRVMYDNLSKDPQQPGQSGPGSPQFPAQRTIPILQPAPGVAVVRELVWE